MCICDVRVRISRDLLTTFLAKRKLNKKNVTCLSSLKKPNSIGITNSKQHYLGNKNLFLEHYNFVYVIRLLSVSASFLPLSSKNVKTD